MLKESAEQEATAVIDAICELMAAHQAVWQHGASMESAKAMRAKAIKLLAKALTPKPF